MSEHDATGARVKHNNLVEMFLKGTEVDQYIVENLYGRERYVAQNDPSFSVGEVTMIEGLNLDETFTHQIQNLHRKSLLSQKQT